MKKETSKSKSKLSGLESLATRTAEWRNVSDKLASKNIKVGAVNVNNSVSVLNTKNGVRYKCTKIIETWTSDKETAAKVRQYFDDLDKNLEDEIGTTAEPGTWLGYNNFKNKNDDDES